jgi:uncharacterized protein YegL
MLALWIIIGVGLFALVGRNPRPGGGALVRRVDRRLCLAGERVRVTLECSAAGLPQPKPAEGTTPWNLVLVIDHSSSMGTGTGSALDEARKAAINLVRTTPSSFRFSVVEFDHEAREVCPLTDRHRGLTRAINGITRGGNTDIALGLRVAAKSLDQADTSAASRRRAVILLSDGGSDPDQASAAADELKSDPDLLLVTVGIGAADMALLRRLASTPDHCFLAERIEELTALYSEIGQMITGRKAAEVRIREHFNPIGRWGLRGWGELQPSGFNLKDGEFSWLLPVLQETPLELTYTLEALCPGWHPVAPAPALLNARIGDDSAHERQSNRGPRVLVLPRVPGWQVLWLILNPIFFYLFGKRFCREQSVAAPRPEPIAATPEALQLPPPLPPAQESEPRLAERPTLIIGLGYAGLHAALHAKRLAWEHGTRIPPDHLRVLAIDTADTVFFPTPTAGLVTLTSEERLTLDRPLEPILTDEAAAAAPRYPWLDAAPLCAGGARPDLHRGTGHQRALGRLAILANRESLETRIVPLVDALIARSGGDGIDVLVTASTGGGTGGGGLLDLCWLIRHLLGQRHVDANSSTSLFLCAPHAEQSLTPHPEELALACANHQALMRELDRFSAMRGERLAPTPELAAEGARNWFDRVFCVGPVANTRWPAEQVLYPKAGELLFAWLASNGPGSLHAHFVTRGTAADRCLVHRLDPCTHYLYPRTVHTFLVVDTLRRTLVNRLWDLNAGHAGGYGAAEHRPAATAALLHAWLETRPKGAEYPWIFNAISALIEPNRLQQSLYRGAGPEISGGVSPLDRNAFFEMQRRLLRGALTAWVLDTLNRGREGVCPPHALGACVHALRDLHQRLREGSDVAGHLVEHSPAPMVRREAGTVAELAAQAVAETEAMIRRLTAWDRHLAASAQGRGLIRLLDERSGLLRAEIQRLRGSGPVTGSPTLPLDWDRLGELPGRFLGTLEEGLSQRLRWDLVPAGIQTTIALRLQGETGQSWSLDDLDRAEESVAGLADALIRLGCDLSRDFRTWRLADYPPEDLPELRPEPPRMDRLDPGARGLYLVQGNPRFKAASHVAQEALTPFDPREARVIAGEEYLPSDRLWPELAVPDLPPFVFAEERNAYRAYDTWCRAQRRQSEPLPATLVGLCRDPAALAAFALTGLAGGHIAARDDGNSRYWFADGLPGASGHIELAKDQADPLAAFLGAANGWIGNPEPTLRRRPAGAVEPPTELAHRISRHELAGAIAGEPWYEHFVAVVWGSLQWL